MCSGDISIKGYISTDRKDDRICLFGKLRSQLSYHPIKEDSKDNEVDLEVTKHAWTSITFDGLPCSNLINVFNLITKDDNPLRYSGDNAVKIPGIKIMTSSDMNYEYFIKTVRRLFPLAFAEIPNSCFKSVDVVIDDKFNTDE